MLLFAVSGVKDDRWHDVVDALSRSSHPTVDSPAKIGAAIRNIEQISPPDAMSLPYLASLFEAVVADTPRSRRRGAPHRDRLVLSLPAGALFADGGVAIVPPRGRCCRRSARF